jgi:predicted acetyltransferase
VPELVLPTARLHAEFLACRDDWGPGLHEDGFGISADDDLDSPDSFAAWVHDRLRLTHLPGTPCPPEQHGSARWIVEDGQVVGGIALRHIFDDEHGHIGYGVRPSARRRGLASWALAQMLNDAKAALTVDRVLIVCQADNFASARTIERNGGVLECMRGVSQEAVRRYWIRLHR